MPIALHLYPGQCAILQWRLPNPQFPSPRAYTCARKSRSSCPVGILAVSGRRSTRRPKAQLPPRRTGLADGLQSESVLVLSWVVPARRTGPILSVYSDTAVPLFWQPWAGRYLFLRELVVPRANCRQSSSCSRIHGRRVLCLGHGKKYQNIGG